MNIIARIKLFFQMIPKKIFAMRGTILLLASLFLTACSKHEYQIIESDSGSSLPGRINISVPFSLQAPHANWDAPYQEACEEMALIMAHYFLHGRELTNEMADKEILDMVKWESENGFSEDVTLEELLIIGCAYFGDCGSYISNEVTKENIKKELAKGNPVIVPAAGRTLLNPYFSGLGPWYHMLVITGYKDSLFVNGGVFITNDPGTRRGEGYEYDYDLLINAVHDWTGVKEEIEEGVKKMMIVKHL